MTEDFHSDLALALPREVFAQITLGLRAALPPPVRDTPVAWARRDRAALAAVAGLLPGNGAEARLAAQFVVLDANATEHLRMAHQSRAEPALASRYDARAMAMMREGKGTLRLLMRMRMQAARRVIEGDETLAGQAAWMERCVAGMMHEVLLVADAADAAAPVADAVVAGLHAVWESVNVSLDAKRSADSCAETEPGFEDVHDLRQLAASLQAPSFRGRNAVSAGMVCSSL
jgi:hypothetical protein